MKMISENLTADYADGADEEKKDVLGLLHLRNLRFSILLLYGFLSAVGVLGTSAETADGVEKGNAQYAAGDFRGAMGQYQSAVETGARNAALFYNLGNACYRAGDFGQAILNYERALLLQPQHPEARANLHLAQDKARALELKPKWWDAPIARATPNQFSIALAVSFWVAAFCFAGWMLAERRRSPLLLVLFILALLAGGVSVAALYALETGRGGGAFAIVTGEKIEARVATADNAGSVLALPPGSEIKILSTRGDWIYAALPSDLRGWLPVGSAQRVRL